ncbi:hypothetical protein J2756_001676 [Methanobacterium aggregans]|nr:hypothetical protein [Methanobacterium aggregans]
MSSTRICVTQTKELIKKVLIIPVPKQIPWI